MSKYANFDWRDNVSYCDNPDHESAPGPKKVEFHKWAEHHLRKLAKALGHPYKKGMIRHNWGGIAVSGEIMLHTPELYAQIEQGALLMGLGILVRKVNPADPTGMKAANTWYPVESLKEMDLFADRLKKELRLTGVAA